MPYAESPGPRRRSRSVNNWREVGRGEQGQGLVEYALILFMVVLVVFVALALIGPGVGSLYSSIYSGL
jgi:pilus assembly protein Flp/PilA